jgi:hypothetical protein
MLGSRMRIHLAMLENYELEIKGVLEGKLDSEVDACALNSPNPDLVISQCLRKADSVPVRTSIGFGTHNLNVELTTFPPTKSELSPCMPKSIQALGLNLSVVIEHTPKRLIRSGCLRS